MLFIIIGVLSMVLSIIGRMGITAIISNIITYSRRSYRWQGGNCPLPLAEKFDNNNITIYDTGFA